MHSSSSMSTSLLNAAAELPPSQVIFGSTPAMLAIKLQIERTSSTNIPVLIRGASGTGKEIVARLIHENSSWSHAPFVKVNCPAIPEALLESELFGYERGAFTGAYARKPGRLEAAHSGTLFLDEVGDLEPGVQAKFLQVLQDGKFCRIGGEEDQKIEVRIISATNHDLEKKMDAGLFRRDLYYRLDGVTLSLPSLSERRDDIPLLIEYFVNHYNQALNRQARALSSSAVDTLRSYPWRGNIRELENVIRRYVIFGQEDMVLADLIWRDEKVVESEVPFNGDFSLKRTTRRAVQEIEHKLILRALAANNWNRKKAAKALEISYRALMYKIQENGIPPLRSNGCRKPLPAMAPESLAEE